MFFFRLLQRIGLRPSDDTMRSWVLEILKTFGTMAADELRKKLEGKAGGISLRVFNWLMESLLQRMQVWAHDVGAFTVDGETYEARTYSLR
jgi:hypothetical protein